MKRPLFWVCLLLSAMALLNLRVWECDSGWKMEEDAGEREQGGFGDGLILQLSGKVSDKEVTDQKVYFVLKVKEISKDQNTADIQQLLQLFQNKKTSKIICYMSREDTELPLMGECLSVRGEFSLNTPATNPGEFDFEEYYRSKGIGGVLYNTSIVSNAGGGSHIRETLYRLRCFFCERLDRIYPVREAGVMKTMLFGDKSSIEPELKKLYQKSGIIHILSISGLHITLLGMGIYRLLRQMGIRHCIASLFCVLLLVMYGLMTGMSVSACRAIGMFLLRMLALLCGRTYDLMTALAVMAAVMLCTEPVYGFGSGFWLSFGSVLGVGTVTLLMQAFSAEEIGNIKPGEMFLQKMCRILKSRIGDGVRSGMGIYLVTLPLLLLFYYEIPVYSPVINLLVVPAMGIVVCFGFLSVLVPHVRVLSDIVIVLLRFFEGTCRAVWGLPLAVWNPGCPAIWQVILYYLMEGVVIIIIRKKNIPKRKVGKYLLLFAPVLLFGLPVHNGFSITFLDVGQGDAIVVRQSCREVFIVDCGSSSRKKVGENVLIPYLKHEGITRVSGVFITHGDRDHINGLTEFFTLTGEEGIRVDKIFLPKLGKDAMKKEFEAFLEYFPDENRTRERDHSTGTNKTELFLVKSGDYLQSGDLMIRVMHPEGEQSDAMSGGNSESLCLYLEAVIKGSKPLTVLLTGDVEGNGEKELVKELAKAGISRISVLKCAHHGSKNATTDELLAQIDPKVAVISCGRNNLYGHPHKELLDRLLEERSSVVRTDRQGAIRICFIHGKWSTLTFWRGT